ncbi:SIT4 phosphatase-associated protein-domain-containing protein [Melanogaster broomeanus]|nr:SIT4 phosphatase-associated protein-domain-containing protein [Melanogaster broomeanus]
MFWRFGFHNTSTIDTLLDKDDVSLEAILDEDDLLQECKSQNTRLIDYFQRVDVLKRLLGYVKGQIEGDEERGRFKYPYVATEVLCSEIWSIVETCVNNSEELLAPFWETVLDRSPEDMKTEMVMASYFAKINAVFLTKKPAEMLAFIQSQPSVVERLLRHVETPSIVDLLVRIIQLDENPGCAGVLEWLSSEHLMGRLISLLSPAHTSDMHTVVSELIKGIISMAAPSPGAGLTEGLQNGPASNRFARELAHSDSISTLVGYILYDFKMDQPLPPSVVHSISIIIELIRKNNSDYFEPYLFHTLRNRLIQNARETLEAAMQEMVDRMGVVNLGSLLAIMCERLPDFQRFLREPRSLDLFLTTVGLIKPLTFERYRICELYAELLHCSNMSLLNRSSEHDHLYDNEGRLQGGLSALETLARVIALGSTEDREREVTQDPQDEVEPALELPVTNPSRESSLMDSDDDMSDEPGSSDDDAMEEIVMDDDLPKDHRRSSDDSQLEQPPMIVPSSPNPSSSPSPSELVAQAAARPGPVRASSSEESITSKAISCVAPEIPVGEKMKQCFLEASVLSTLLDLFFEFPWNNFLHSVGRVEGGLNRELAIALFRDAQLMKRIVDGQKRNDVESSKPKGVRLGYMGHLTLMSEDVIAALEHFSPDLRLIIEQYAPQPAWNDYVTGRYKETKTRDTSLLGGGKPAVGSAPRAGVRWAVDEEDAKATVAPSNGTSGIKGEFKRNTGARPAREASADFGPAPMEDEDDEDDDHGAGPPQELQSGEYCASDTSDDDDDDDGGWLAQSTFDLAKPPPTRRHHSGHSSSVSGFDDAFHPSTSGALREALSDDPFGVNSYDEDDSFGPFSDPAAVGAPDPFTFTSSGFPAISSDDSFDFGDFQSGDHEEPRDGDLTPTAGSWTFTSGSETEGDSEGDEFGNVGGRRSRNGLQTISLDEVSERFERRKYDWDS